jgi:hypothetical protein
VYRVEKNCIVRNQTHRGASYRQLSGYVKPAFELAQTYQALYFIADYHALTTVQDAKILNHMVYDVAATLVALGLDPDAIPLMEKLRCKIGIWR